MTPALVLTAGLATRLRPLSLVRAKAALPVAGQPLVSRILGQLAAAGVRDAVLNLHHLPHTITGVLGDGSGTGLRVRYSWEVPILGSAGGPRRALPLLAAETFFIVNGDTLTDADLPSLLAEHRATGALVTLAVGPQTEPMKYGGVVSGDDGVVTGFAGRRSAEPSSHFVGVQAVQAEAFASLAADTPAESIAALYPALIASRPGSVRALRCATVFHDIGTPADYMRTALALGANAPDTAWRGARVSVHPSARLERSLLWDDVEVGAGCVLRRCVVTDRVRVPPGTTWDDVSIREADDGPLADGETRIGGLAVARLGE